ncbi:MAG TPA: TetR/AcrR family transcriptional regulator [Solirubrobacterales bacterium]
MATDTRERILEAACDLIAAEGIDDMRIARVAMRAGASTALVHHYFSTREELLEQALLHSFELAGDERFAAGRVGGSATAQLAAAIEECLPGSGRLQRDWVLWVELWLRAAREPELRPFAAQLYERYRDWLSGVIDAGVQSGEFERPADLEDLVDRAMAMLDGTGLRSLLRDPAMDLSRARRLVAELLGGELGVDPEELIAKAEDLG